MDRLGPSSRFSGIYLKEKVSGRPTRAFPTCPGRMSGPRGRLPTSGFMINQIPRCPGSTPEVTPNAAGTQLDPRPTWKLEEHGLVTINSYLVTFYGHLDCISGNFMCKC